MAGNEVHKLGFGLQDVGKFVQNAVAVAVLLAVVEVGGLQGAITMVAVRMVELA